MANGAVVSPTIRLEYSRGFGGAFTQVMNYANDPSAAYNLAFRTDSQSSLLGSFGVKVGLNPGLTWGVEYILAGATDGGGSYRRGFRGALQAAF